MVNVEDGIIDQFNNNRIPNMIRFIQAESERKRKDLNLESKLITIVKNYKIHNDYDFITVILSFMAILKESEEMIFIIFEVNINS